MDDDEIIEAPILQTMISDGTSIFPVDTVLYQEKYWLVRGWMQSGDGKWKKPARLISLESFQFQDLRNTNHPTNFRYYVAPATNSKNRPALESL